MKKLVAIAASSIILWLSLDSHIAYSQEYRSKYAGQEYRKIKSLSAEAIKELMTGEGWGLAKAAELNGYPGPAHLLQMKEEIKLTPEQIRQIEKLDAEMKEAAIPLGVQLVEKEKALNESFAKATVNQQNLAGLLEQIADTYQKLRLVHLSAHLKTPELLTSTQIEKYNKLRGYSLEKDPCENIPQGHDPAMWKKHHNCNEG